MKHFLREPRGEESWADAVMDWRIERMNLPESAEAAHERLMEDVLASLSQAVAVVRDNQVLYVNAAFVRLFGFSTEDLMGGSLREFIVPDARQHEVAELTRAVDQFGSASLDTVRRSKNGGLADVAIDASPLAVDGVASGYVFTFRDISDRKRMEAKLQHDALHDPLTGLPNRALFMDRLGLVFTRRSRSRGQNCAVLFLDLDRFKEINDSLGHAAGDEVLVTVAKRLRSALRPQDTAARLGGDEFAILVENIVSGSDIEIVASRILREMERPFELGGRSVHAGASIGAAIAGPAHAAPELLIRDADFAMYRAKQNGGGRFEVFDKQLEVQVASLQEHERELREVIDQRQFEVWYEPICRLQPAKPQTGQLWTVKLEGFESLLRWRRTDGSVVSFNDLLPVAEETGLSVSLGRETMEAVCRQLRKWTEALPKSELSLTVNLTQRQFYHPEMIAQVKKTLELSGADPGRLLFEVGEATLSENPDLAFDLIERLLGCNVRLAVDDFGSGLTPLSHLVRLPIDVLKLDPRLTLAAVHPAAHAGRQSAVLESLIQLSQKLGVQVVAQGIQTRAQVDALVQMGCTLGQGPLLGLAIEPGPAQELAARGWWTIAPEA
jgi:diguanylate cyclase (GGDEF)-like protein/PAS domain S-box-containing protein